MMTVLCMDLVSGSLTGNGKVGMGYRLVCQWEGWVGYGMRIKQTWGGAILGWWWGFGLTKLRQGNFHRIPMGTSQEFLIRNSTFSKCRDNRHSFDSWWKFIRNVMSQRHGKEKMQWNVGLGVRFNRCNTEKVNKVGVWVISWIRLTGGVETWHNHGHMIEYTPCYQINMKWEEDMLVYEWLPYSTLNDKIGVVDSKIDFDAINGYNDDIESHHDGALKSWAPMSRGKWGMLIWPQDWVNEDWAKVNSHFCHFHFLFILGVDHFSRRI